MKSPDVSAMAPVVAAAPGTSAVRRVSRRATPAAHGDGVMETLVERATRGPIQAKSIGHGYGSLVAAAQSPRASSGRTLQRALAISEPGDRDEREADEVAGQVMRMEAPHIQRATPPSIQRKCAACGGALEDARPIQRMCTDCEEEEQQQQQIQRREAGGDAGAAATTATTADSRQEAVDAVRGGQPLPREERAFFEPRFGADFSGVRVHTDRTADTAARSVSALAYTRGSDIVFRQGQYQPGTSSGRTLLAHELTHVLQQGAASQAGGAVQDGASSADGVARTEAS
jgi:Domain of unknown function (DUF4157)